MIVDLDKLAKIQEQPKTKTKIYVTNITNTAKLTAAYS
jgi:hypothetical protein